MKTIRLFTAVALLGATRVYAIFDSGPPTDTNEYLAKLFGQNTAFTALAHLSVKNKSNKESHAAQIHYSFLEGKLRADIDMGKTKAAEKHADAAALIAAFGMDNMVCLLRPDKKASYVIYPGLQGYCETPLAAPKDSTTPAPPKIQKTEAGRETIDGHPCIKNKVVITDADGKKTELMSWEAIDMKNFPLQTEILADGNTVTTLFKDIKFVKPPSGIFEVPSSFKRYDSLKDMAMGAVQQLLQQQNIK